MKNEINEKNKCSPCWAFNLINNGVTIFLCNVYFRGRSEDTKNCPCKKCLIRSTCEERCDEQALFGVNSFKPDYHLGSRS